MFKVKILQLTTYHMDEIAKTAHMNSLGTPIPKIGEIYPAEFLDGDTDDVCVNKGYIIGKEDYEIIQSDVQEPPLETSL